MEKSDKIKKGMECYLDPDGCNDQRCNAERCPYAADLLPAEITCADRIITDCLAYIRHLETANAELLTKVEQLEAKCHQLERERDAAVECLRGRCDVCRWEETAKCASCHHDVDAWNAHDDNWEWRGVKEE